jgi:hypothetical protein
MGRIFLLNVTVVDESAATAAVTKNKLARDKRSITECLPL